MPEIISPARVLIVFRIHGKELIDIVFRDSTLTVDEQISKVCNDHDVRRSDCYGYEYRIKIPN